MLQMFPHLQQGVSMLEQISIPKHILNATPFLQTLGVSSTLAFGFFYVVS
jgi:hypothetical protein